MIDKIDEFKSFLGAQNFKLFIGIVVFVVFLATLDFFSLQFLYKSIPFELNPAFLVAVFVVAFLANSYFGLLAGLYLVMAAVPFDKVGFIGGLRFTEVLFAAFFLRWLISFVFEKKVSFKLNKLSLPLGLFFIANLFSLQATDDLVSSTKRIIILFYLVLLFHLFVNLIKTRKDLIVSMLFFITPLLISSLYAVFQFFSPYFWQISKDLGGATNWLIGEVPRIVGGYRDPNFLAMNISVILGLLLVFYLTLFGKKYGFWLIGSIGLLVSALFLTASRSNWVTVGFLILFAGVLFLRNKENFFQFAKLITISFLVVYTTSWISGAVDFRSNRTIPFSSTAISDRAKAVVVESAEASGDRLNAYRAALLMAKDHPLFGVGVERFSANYDKYIPQDQTHFPSVTAHNIYLETLAEKGIFGFFAFVWTIILSLTMLFRGYLKNRGEIKVFFGALLVSLAGFLTSTMFLTGLYELFFWFLLGFSMVLVNLWPERTVKKTK